MIDDNTDRMLPTADVMTLTGTTKSTLYRWINEKKFPEPIKVHGCNRWWLSTIKNWMAQYRTAES